jgi:hypothetical protein
MSHDRRRLMRRAAQLLFHNDPTRRRFLTDAMLSLSYSKAKLSLSLPCAFPIVETFFLLYSLALRIRKEDNTHENTPRSQTYTHTHTQHTDGENIHVQIPAFPPHILQVQTRPYQLHPTTPHQQTGLLQRTIPSRQSTALLSLSHTPLLEYVSPSHPHAAYSTGVLSHT